MIIDKEPNFLTRLIERPLFHMAERYGARELFC